MGRSQIAAIENEGTLARQRLLRGNGDTGVSRQAINFCLTLPQSADMLPVIVRTRMRACDPQILAPDFQGGTMRRLLPPVLLCAALLLPALGLRAGTIIVGSPPDTDTGNCYPFGCAYASTYEQVYTSSQFSGSVTITGLQFFNTEVDEGATAMNSGTWTISLSTTSANWNTLSPIFASNIGTDNTTVFSGNLAQPWAFGDTLTITFTTPFTYNPSDGNLLIEVVASGTSASGGFIYFNTNGYNDGGENGNTILGRDYCAPGSGCPTEGSISSGYGLETGFLTTTTSPSPEPASLFLVGAGLLGLIALGRVRTHVVRTDA
jgi:hypothetical protein